MKNLLKLSFILLCLITSLSFASEKKVIEVIIPFNAGGPSDILWRNIEPKLNLILEKDNIVLRTKNVPGAGGSIGLNELMQSQKPTLGFFSSFFAINKFVRTDTNYDYTSVNLIGFAGNNTMIVMSAKHKSLQELQIFCKNNELLYGSSGTGSTSELLGFYFAKKIAKCEKVSPVAYRTTTLANVDLRNKQLDYLADFSISASEQIDGQFLYKLYEMKNEELTPWHIFVSNKVQNKDIDTVRQGFELLKKDKEFVRNLEKKLHIQGFSEQKNSTWLEQEFFNFQHVISQINKKSK